MTIAQSKRPGPDLAVLLESAAAGDESAWRELVGMYWRRVFALARSRCGSTELAEEVTQSVFVTVAQQLGKGAYQERGRFEPWLFRVAVNRLRDEARRLKRQATVTDPASFTGLEAPATPSAPAQQEELAALRTAIAKLSDADREIIELRHHGGMGFRQIAELLGEPRGTLLARHHRALAKLRDLLRPAAAKDDIKSIES